MKHFSSIFLSRTKKKKKKRGFREKYSQIIIWKKEKVYVVYILLPKILHIFLLFHQIITKKAKGYKNWYFIKHSWLLFYIDYSSWFKNLYKMKDLPKNWTRFPSFYNKKKNQSFICQYKEYQKKIVLQFLYKMKYRINFNSSSWKTKLA